MTPDQEKRFIDAMRSYTTGQIDLTETALVEVAALIEECPGDEVLTQVQAMLVACREYMNALLSQAEATIDSVHHHQLSQSVVLQNRSGEA